MLDPERNNPQEFEQDSCLSPLPSLRTTSDTEAMGDFHYSSENFTLALEYFEKAYQRAQSENEQGETWRLACKIGDCFRRKGLYSEARAWVLIAQSRLSSQQSSPEYGLVLYRLGDILIYTGCLEEALQTCFQAYELLKNSPLHAEVAETLNRIAIIYMRMGYPREAEEFFTDALVTFRRVDHHLGVTLATMNLGLIKKNACEYEDALALFDRSLELANQHSFQKVRVSLLLNSGIVHYKLGRDREASERFAEVRRLARAAGDEDTLARASTSLGRVQIRLGNLRRAEQFLLEGRVLAEKNHIGRSIALADEFLGELAEARGDLEAAMANYEVALDLALSIAPKGDVVVEVLQRMARVKLAQGLPLEAVRLAERALKICETSGELYEVPYLHRTQARAWLRLEQLDRAEAAFRNALQVFKKTRDLREEKQTLLELASFQMKQPTLERALRARKILEDLLQSSCDERADRFFFQVSLMLARVESWLGELDRALLAVFDAESYLPTDASPEETQDLAQVRGQVEHRKIVQGKGHFGFLPGHEQLALSTGGREELPANLRSAWRALFELCDADAGCLCMDGADGGPFEFLEGMNKKEIKVLRASHGETMDPNAAAAGSEQAGALLYQPLLHSGKEVGFLCLWRKNGNGPFSHEMVRYMAGFARMVTLIVYHSQGEAQISRRSFRGQDLPKAAESIITQDPGMLDLLHLAGMVAETSAWVLISGETGTGKGVLAQAIHRMSPRRDKRFVHVNCAALPEELLESELFGHVKGSFTGAICDKPGLIEEASGGTLFLDEVGKTSLKMQAKLLQFLDTREIRRVGANDSMPVDVRLITATKTDLKLMAQEGLFLEDLYYRLNDFPLRIPPLRERPGDIALLAHFFIDRYAAEFGKRIRGISPAALAKLEAGEWAGNVRELEKVVKRALLLSADDQPLAAEAVIVSDDLQSRATAADLDLKRQVSGLEKHLLVAALERFRGNRSLASKGLGISYPTLLQKIRKHGLES